MELGFTLWILLLLTLSGYVLAQPDTIIRLTYNLDEDSPSRTRIGSLKSDSGLDQHYNPGILAAMRFEILPDESDHEELFRLNRRSGNLDTVAVVDRDVICPRMDQCIVHLDVRVTPYSHFHIIKVDITLIDRNDNHPTFSDRSIAVPISEIASPGYAFNLPIADDLDGGDYGVQRYELEHPSDLFRITTAGRTPQLVLQGHLDRETREYYSLGVLAYDGGAPPKSGELLVAVNVMDVNDNKPTFDQAVYEVTILENVEAETSIIQVSATDPDAGENGELLYSFSTATQTQYGHLFRINSATGEVYVLENLDHEVQQEYELSLFVYDRGPIAQSGNAKLIVHIQDINNHAPDIRSSSISASGYAEISEMANIGEFVAHLTVVDPDSGAGGDFECSLISNEFSLEEIGYRNFKILTTTRFDRESKEYYEVDVLCRDHGNPPLESRRRIPVRILDENDHSPVFLQDVYDVAVPENYPLRRPVGQVNATDDDIGSNARLRYRIQSPSGDATLLEVDSESGELRTKGVFDHERQNGYEYIVVATDRGKPPQSATATVRVSVLDRNDEAPVFEQQHYSFGTFENQPIGTEIGTLVAHDADSAQYGDISYRLDHYQSDKLAARTFTIGEKTGNITTRRFLDRESRAMYNLSVIAENPGSSLSSSTKVTIQIADKNDNAPIITYPTLDDFRVQVPSSAHFQDVVTHVTAEDRDLGKNAELRYSIVEGDAERVFEIHPYDGKVIANRELRPFIDRDFRLTVLVEDRGLPQMSAVATLKVYVNGSMAAIPEGRGLPLPGNTLLIIIVAASLAFVLVLATLVGLVLWRRRRYATAGQHGNKYNCRIEANKALQAAQKAGKKPIHVSAPTDLPPREGSPGRPPKGVPPKGDLGQPPYRGQQPPWQAVAYVDTIDIRVSELFSSKF